MIIDDNDILLIESELEYNNYLAQKELLDELAGLATKVTESSTKYILEADIKGAITNYLHKIVNNVQVAWNRFKRKITESAWKKIEKRYEKELNMDRSIVVENASESDVFVNWDALKQYLSQDFRFVVTKDMKDLDETVIIKQSSYFSSINKFSKAEMQQIVSKNVFTPIKRGSTINLQLIQGYRDELDKIDTYMTPIENTLKIFNQYEKQAADVSGYADQVSITAADNTQEAFNMILSKAQDYIYLSELKATDQEDPNGNEVVKANGGELQKNVTKMCKVITTYLSVQMWAVNRASTKSMSVVLSYVRNAAKYNPNRKKPEKNNKEENKANK